MAALALPVTASDRQSGGGGRKVDENGRIVFENQPTGLLEIDISAGRARAHFHQNLRIAPGDNDLGVIRLYESKVVTIRVVNEKGEPQTVALTWTNLDHRTFPQPLRTNRTIRGEGDGVYKIGVGPGRYLVSARLKDGQVGVLDLDTRTVGDEPIELVIPPGGTFEIDATQMQRGQTKTLTIFGRNRLPMYASYIRNPGSFQRSLPIGTYTYEIHRGIELIDQGSLKIAKGSEPRLTIR